MIGSDSLFLRSSLVASEFPGGLTLSLLAILPPRGLSSSLPVSSTRALVASSVPSFFPWLRSGSSRRRRFSWISPVVG